VSDLARAESHDDTALPARALRSLLDLGAAQIDAALKDSDLQVARLTRSLTSLLQPAAAAGEATNAEDFRKLVNERVLEVLVCMQFYDKLVQRLTHVKEGLEIPARELLVDGGPSRATVDSVLEKVYTRYSMVEERVLFDFLVRGLGGAQMARAMRAMRPSQDAGEMEAF
jgi:hypothetical protein